MKFLKSINFYQFLSISTSLALFLPLVASGAGFVPCGGPGESSCTYCDFLSMGDGILKFIFEMIFPIVAVVFVIGGIMIMTAGSSPDRVKKGTGAMKAAVIGLLIALLAWVFLDTMFKFLAPKYTEINYGNPWNVLKCR